MTPIRYILVSLSSFLLALTLNAEEATSTVQNTSLEVDSVELQDIRFAGYLEDSSVAMAVTRFAKNPAIKIDGHIDEEVWLQVVPHDRFVVTDPDTLEMAPLQTKVRMAYNDSGFYLAAEMIQDPDTLIRRLSARDEGFLNRDYFSFQLDTSGEGRYGFWFQLNLGDSRADGTVKPERQFSDNWDGAWYGQTQSTEYGWTAEFFIPWSVVAMPKVEGMRKMGIYMSRKVASVDQRYSWPALPFTQPKFLSAFQPLLFESVNAPRQLSFIPYISSSFDSISDDSSHSLGTDFFWRPSTNFQVTATMLPDFGTVESDSVIVNLTAIETFYPEKRLFFLEGQEIFQMSSRSGGFSSNSMVSMLHTRRIGQKAITPDIPEDAEFTWSDFSRPVDLLRAGKATGTAGEFSYGFLAAQEDDSTFHGTLYGEPISINQSGRDFGVVRGLWEKSNGSYKGLGFMSTKVMHPTGDVHTHGVDTHYFSADGKFKVDSTLMMSDLPNDPTGYGAIVDIQYAPKRGVRHELALEQYDDEFNLNHMGFLGRNDQRKVKYYLRVNRSTGGALVREQYTRFSVDSGWNGASELIERGVDVNHQFTFHNLSQIRVGGSYKPAQIDDRNSFGNGSFEQGATKEIDVRYSSDSSKKLYYNLGGEIQTENTDGQSRRVSSSVVYRPSGRVSMFLNLSYRDRDAWLLYRGGRNFAAFETESWGPRMVFNYFIHANQYVRFDLEWMGIRATEMQRFTLPVAHTKLAKVDEDQLGSTARDGFSISRMNLQLRYRWEIAPMSDLFLVYTKSSDLPNAIEYSFIDQFTETLGYASDESFVIKLRHRIGT